MKPLSRLWIISAERSWKVVCNDNQTVKAVSKIAVNGNAYVLNLQVGFLQNIIGARGRTNERYLRRANVEKLRWTIVVMTMM